MDYLAFLKLLLSVGPKLPQLMEHIQAIVDQVTAIAALLGVKSEISHNAPEITPDVLAAEGQIAAKLVVPGEHGAIGDGTLLRNLFAFVQEHPELIALLLKFIK